MFPWVYGFHWTPYHVIFLVVFFSVVALVFTTVGIALLRVRKDFASNRAEGILWHSEFEDLPEASRVCRHELTGEVQNRTCHHEFDCRSCTAHPAFLAKYDPAGLACAMEQDVYGFRMSMDRMYHRGHTWVRKEEDGTFTIGLDEFGARLLGTPDAVDLPEVGAHLHANGTAWRMKKQKANLRILAPIDGEVIERGGPDRAWYLRVRADDSEQAGRHLLRGAEIRPWILREMERLQMSMAVDGVGASLADGGELVPDMWKDYPQVDWDGVWGEMFLES